MCRVSVPDVSRLAFPMCRGGVPDVSTLQIRGAGLNLFLPNGAPEGSKSRAAAPGAARGWESAETTRHFGNALPCPASLRKRFWLMGTALARAGLILARGVGFAETPCADPGQGARRVAESGSTRAGEVFRAFGSGCGRDRGSGAAGASRGPGGWPRGVGCWREPEFSPAPREPRRRSFRGLRKRPLQAGTARAIAQAPVRA